MSTEAKFIIAIGVATIGLIIGGVFFFSKGSKTQEQQIDQSLILSNVKHSKGNTDAKIKIVEFADFQCPACGTAYPIVKKVIEANSDKVYYAFRHFPLPSHNNGKIAGQAAEAAGNQGKFWEMHDMLFEKQSEWSGEGDPEKVFEGYAQNLSLDTQKFKEDMKNAIGTVNQDASDGKKLTVSSTPTFFINGQKYPGVVDEATFLQIINNPSQ